MEGNKFFLEKSGKQFSIRGATYAPPIGTRIDMLADDNEWCAEDRDIAYLKNDFNVIRVWIVDRFKPHTRCMNALAAANIYVIINIDTPLGMISDPQNPVWTNEMYEHYTTIVDIFAQFRNVLGFSVTGRLFLDQPYYNPKYYAIAKAATRDLKAHIKAKGYRKIPVGATGRDELQDGLQASYLTCGNSSQSTADFWGLEHKDWCVDAKEFAEITSVYRQIGVPMFVSDFGCNKAKPRTFKEEAAFFSNSSSEVVSIIPNDCDGQRIKMNSI